MEPWEWLVLSLIVAVFLATIIYGVRVALEWHRVLSRDERRYGIRKDKE